MNRPQKGADRIDLSRRLLLTAVLFTAACLALATGFGIAGGRLPLLSDRVCFRELGLSFLSLTPAGSPLRSPETVLPGIDLRFSPALFRTGSDPAGILLPGNVRSQKRGMP